MKGFDLPRKEVKNGTVEKSDQQLCQSSPVQTNTAHEPPAPNCVYWECCQIQNRFQLWSTQSLYGRKRNVRETVEEEQKGNELHYHSTLGRELRSYPQLQDIFGKKNKHSRYWRHRQQQILDRSGSNVLDLISGPS